MAKQQIRLPINIALIKKKIIENNDYSSHEINDAILDEIKKQFEKLLEVEIVKGRTLCKVCLNHRESKLMDEITATYGITFTQLYIGAILNIAKNENLINKNKK